MYKKPFVIGASGQRICYKPACGLFARSSQYRSAGTLAAFHLTISLIIIVYVYLFSSRASYLTIDYLCVKLIYVIYI